MGVLGGSGEVEEGGDMMVPIVIPTISRSDHQPLSSSSHHHRPSSSPSSPAASSDSASFHTDAAGVKRERGHACRWAVRLHAARRSPFASRVDRGAHTVVGTRRSPRPRALRGRFGDGLLEARSGGSAGAVPGALPRGGLSFVPRISGLSAAAVSALPGLPSAGLPSAADGGVGALGRGAAEASRVGRAGCGSLCGGSLCGRVVSWPARQAPEGAGGGSRLCALGAVGSVGRRGGGPADALQGLEGTDT